MDIFVSLIGFVILFLLFSAMCSVTDALVKKAMAGMPKPYDAVFLVMALITIITVVVLVWVLT